MEDEHNMMSIENNYPTNFNHHEIEGTPDDVSMVGGMMKMYFHFGLGDLLLFPGLKLDSNLKLILSCIVLFILALFLEALNYVRRIRCECELRPFKSGKHPCGCNHNNSQQTGNCHNNNEQQQQQQQQQQAITIRCCSDEQGNEGNNSTVTHCEFGLFRSEKRSYKLFQASLYCFQTSLAFVLMLAAMTYNVCIIFAIVSGTAIGFFIFYRPNEDVTVVCH